jgi:hypothetical protein
MSKLFIARYDISSIDFALSDPANNIWRVAGTIEDPTGSFLADAASLNDKIIMRGYHEDGYIVYDRYEIETIVTVNGKYLELDILYEIPTDPNTQYVGDPVPQIMGNTPITGSFPIGSDLAYRDFIRMPSTYQHMIDPDYAAGMEALNFEQISEFTDQEDVGLNETPDNSRQRFSTLYQFVPGSTKLYVNGVRQRKGTGLGYIEEFWAIVDGGNDTWTIWIYWPPEADSGLICEYKRV